MFSSLFKATKADARASAKAALQRALVSARVCPYIFLIIHKFVNFIIHKFDQNLPPPHPNTWTGVGRQKDS